MWSSQNWAMSRVEYSAQDLPAAPPPAGVPDMATLFSSRIPTSLRSICIRRSLAPICEQGGMKSGSKMKWPEPSRWMRAIGSVTRPSSGSESSRRTKFLRPNETGFSSRPVVSS